MEKNSIEGQLRSTKSETKRRTLLKRLGVVNKFIKSGNRPEWMVLKVLPVLPPDLRPLVMLDGGKLVSSDLNDLYKRLINRNNRLGRVIQVKAPDVIIKNEMRMLQEACDALMDNTKRASPAKAQTGNRVLKSLSDYLRGKQGRFRMNLLGKRVDYSGRSVIVVGPELRLQQCGLPKLMALELFKPFIFARLSAYGVVNSIKAAKRMIENKTPEVWDALEEIVKEHLVLLNRAPTLHRLGIQAFEPKLIESKAIQLHPLVCKAFNADFDGDQMAVHIPLSIEAQIEARVLMISSNNILSPQNGQPVIVPTKDIVVGLYCITSSMEDAKGNGKVFGNYSDMIHAIDNGIIAVNSWIKYYYTYSEHPDPIERGLTRTIDTTPGRVMLYNLLPKDGKISFEDMNITMNNKTIANVIDLINRVYGKKMAVIFADQSMALGFHYSTMFGVSFGKDDMVVPDTKKDHIEKTKERIKLTEEQYMAGFITAREKYNQVTDFWSECTDKVAKDMMDRLALNINNSKVNSIYIMMNSGARASEALMRQLCGMRGLIAKPSGEIIETPIISNFKEGMSVFDYFTSTHGSRKGITDTSLKTADAGYLTRRLVDVAQDCIVLENDCGTHDGITYRVKVEEGVVKEKLSDMIFGRVLASNLVDVSGNTILQAGTLVDNDNVQLIDSASILQAKVRSVVVCQTKNGVCSKCYGRDLSTSLLVNSGEAVGVVAAQSIGEPGAQLTMRTFHIGGATSKTVEKSSIETSHEGVVKWVDMKVVQNSAGKTIVTGNKSSIVITDSKGNERARYYIPYGAHLKVQDGQDIAISAVLATVDPYNFYIISEYEGFVDFKDMVSGVSYKEKADEDLGISNKVIVDWKSVAKTLNPRIGVVDANGNRVQTAQGIEVVYLLPINSIISINNRDSIKIGDPIARIPRDGAQGVKDITGGLPRVEDIFEARIPKQAAVISEIDGIAEFVDGYRIKNRLVIKSIEDSEQAITYNLPRGRHIRVQNGAFVKRGEIIVNGDMDPHDVLAVSGVEELTLYMVQEVQDVYRLQGVKIDNKHIEIIVRSMLQKVEISDAAESDFVNGQEVDLSIAIAYNEEAEASGKKPLQYKRILQGITKASIQTNSFLSAASFQETTKVLVEAAVAGKKDYLQGMKESLLVGRLIPAGTGYVMNKIRQEALLQDKNNAPMD